jgi:hypothetical protein
MAKSYINNLSEEARKGMQEKAEQGILLGRFHVHIFPRHREAVGGR